MRNYVSLLLLYCATYAVSNAVTAAVALEHAFRHTVEIHVGIVHANTQRHA